MVLPTDRVQLLKQESASLGGTGADQTPYPAPIQPQEDAIEAFGLYFQDGSNRDESVLAWRSGDDLYFKDVSQADVSLSTLADKYTQAEVDGLFTAAGFGGKSAGCIAYWSDADTLTENANVVITGTGKVGIGVTPVSPKLHVYDNVQYTYMTKFQNDGNNISRWGIAVQCGADDGAAAGTVYYFAAQDGDGGGTGYLQTVNGVFAVADISDERVKDDIAPTEVDGLGIINALEVVEFRFKNSEYKHRTGFTAQQVEPTFPEMVSEAAAHPDDPPELKFKTTSRTALIPVLTKAVQELSEQLSAALDRIAVLETV